MNKWIIIATLLFTSCCDRECGISVWQEYIQQEADIHNDMEKLVPERGMIFLSSYLVEVLHEEEHPQPSPYRVHRDSRERTLLNAKMRFIKTQRDIELDRCYCLYDDLESEARSQP